MVKGHPKSACNGTKALGEVSLIVSDCDGICDQPTTVQVPIISSSSVISGPDIVCIGDVAVYSVPKWMDVEYDWNVSGGTVVSTNGNQVSVMWANPGVGSIDVNYESPFLLGLKEHNAPDCSGEGDLTVEVLPELLFTQAPNAACVENNLVLHQRNKLELERQCPSHGCGVGRLV